MVFEFYKVNLKKINVLCLLFSDVYVYGGSTDGLKNVDTTEVLKLGSGRFKKIK